MGVPSVFFFGPFRFDPAQKCLTRGRQKIHLSGKALDVLHYLLQHPNEIVTKKDLLAAAWKSDAADEEDLRAYVRMIRRGLGDKAKSSRFIESVYGDGYRFIGKVQSSESRRNQKLKVFLPPLGPNPQHSTATLVGREAELAQLHNLLEKTVSGQRQVVFVSGEPGSGKTALLKSFVSQLAGSQGIFVAFGQCMERHGSGEPYQPVIEALEGVRRQAHRRLLISRLRECAPLWLAEMPALLNSKQRIALQRKTRGASRERMQREFANFIEVLTTNSSDHQSPVLVLCLEDLHWSDPSTLDLLMTLARRLEPARLLLLATYRPVEVLTHNHRLRTVQAELQAHQQCTGLRLEGLNEAAIVAYLSQRFAVERQLASVQGLAQTLHRRTGGNPFLFVTMVDDLVARGVTICSNEQRALTNEADAVTTGVPTRLKEFIEKYLDRLVPEDQQILLVASVTEGNFSAPLIASVLNSDQVEEIDQRCATLARRQQFLQLVGVDVRHNRRKFDRYAFRHALSREVCFDRLTTGQRRNFHQRIAVWKEAVYGPRADVLAAELALHFDRGHDPQRATRYYQLAAENAVRRYASQEAVTHLQRALSLLHELPDTPTRVEQELGLQFQLRVQLGRLKGEATPELKAVVQRIEELSQQVELTPQLFWAFTGVYLFYLIREELQTAQHLARQRLQLAQRFPSPLFAMAAHTELGIASFFLGQIVEAHSHFRQAIALYDLRAPHPFFFDWEHGPPCFCYAAFVAWQLGDATQAQQLIEQALSRSRSLHLPYMEAFSLNCAALLAALCGQTSAVQERTSAAMSIATTHGFLGMVDMAKIYCGWAHAHSGGGEETLQQMQQSMSGYQIGGGDAFRAIHLALYADACRIIGHTTEGLAALSEALSLAQRTGGQYYGAELYWIKGTLVLESTVQGLESENPSLQPLAPSTRAAVEQEAEECFLNAIDTAHRQGAKSFELRATISLARLWQRDGRGKEARQRLEAVYNCFTEGSNINELREAKALLDTLSH